MFSSIVIFPFGFSKGKKKKHAYLFTKWASRFGEHHYIVVFDVLFDQVFYGSHLVGDFRRRRPRPLETRHYETNGGKYYIAGDQNICSYMIRDCGKNVTLQLPKGAVPRKRPPYLSLGYVTC